MNGLTLMAISSWLGISALTVCILMGHDSTLVEALAGINLAILAGAGYKIAKGG